MPNGETNPFMEITNPVYFASTPSIASNSLNEAGIYRKKPNKNAMRRKDREEDAFVMVRMRTPATIEDVSQRNVREI